MTTYSYRLGDRPVVIHAPGVGEFDRDAQDAMLADFDAAGGLLGLDVESTSHDRLGPLHRDFRVRTVQLASPSVAYVLRLDDPDQRDAAETVLRDPRLRFASHTRYDVLAVMREFGVDVSDRWVDTRLLARMAYPLSMDRSRKREGDEMVDLKTLASRHLGGELAFMDRALDERFARLWAESGGRRNASKREITAHGFNTVDLADETFAVYAGLDAIACRALVPVLIGEAESTSELLGTECWLAGLVTRMQWRGMRVDHDRLEAMACEARESCEAAERALVSRIGLTPRQHAKLIAWFREHGVDFEAHGHEHTPSGQPKLDKDSVEGMLDYDVSDEVREVVRLLLDYKERENALAKTKEMQTLVAGSFDGRLHPTVDSLGAITARMTASEPNVQNFSKEQWRIRTVLLPDEGHVLIGADFDQIELRVAAALSQEPDLLRTIREGGDLHQLTADKTGTSRQVAKRVNFLLLYGGGARPLAKATGIDEEEARRVVTEYWDGYRRIAAYRRELESLGTELRTVTYRRIPAGTDSRGEPATYKFLNYMIQSSSRDILVMALYRLWRAGYGDALFVPIHDEIILQVPEDDVDRALKVLEESMTMEFLGVPITASAVVLRDEDGVSRWMTCDAAERIAGERRALSAS